MFDLEQTSRSQLQPLFAGLAQTHGSVRAVLANPELGRLCVDDVHRPSAALLWGAEGVYLGGVPDADRSYQALGAAIEPWAYLYPTPEWAAVLPGLMPRSHRIPHERVRLTAYRAPERPCPLQTGYRLELLSERFGFAAIHNGKVVSRCAADMVVGDYVEIGVETHADHRRRGLAFAVASASLHAAVNAGMVEIGWHCLASNRGSLALARGLGFEKEQAYIAFSASLPAENVGDLPEAECRRLALHFEVGAGDIHFLLFHAASAWALAGEPNRALDAIEALIAGGWHGEARWLENHWAFEALRGDQRFGSAVSRQRRAKEEVNA